VAIVDAITSNPIISGVIVAVLSGIIVQLWRQRQQKKQRAREWYEDSLGMLGRLQQAARRATEYQDNPDYDSLRERLEPLTEEMIEHANSAPTKVHEQSRIDLAAISAFATGLIILTEQSEEMDVVELYETVQEHARESYDGNYDMDDVDEIFGPFPLDDFVDETDRDVDLDEEKAEDFIQNFSEESIEAGRPTTVDEALNMPISGVVEAVDDDGYLESMLEDSLEEYVRTILINVIEDTHETMERRKKLV
jgi:hypothetical protein